MTKLNLGSGDVLLKGFINIDLHPKADVRQDLRQPLPYAENTIDYIYSEHFIEHLTYDEARRLMNECYRVLKPCGVIRIATPDLDHLIDKYQNGWQYQKWLEHPDYKFITSAGMMINYAVRAWGHKYIWNAADLYTILKQAGFSSAEDRILNESWYQELRNLEIREDSTLIMEAMK